MAGICIPVLAFDTSLAVTLRKIMLIAVQVVPTEYRYLSKEVLPTNQFSVTEYFVPIRESDRAWPG